MTKEDEEKLRRRAEFLEQKRKRREAEAMTQEQIIEEARKLFSTPASKKILKSWKRSEKKNKIEIRTDGFNSSKSNTIIFLNWRNQ